MFYVYQFSPQIMHNAAGKCIVVRPLYGITQHCLFEKQTGVTTYSTKAEQLHLHLEDRSDS